MGDEDATVWQERLIVAADCDGHRRRCAPRVRPRVEDLHRVRDGTGLPETTRHQDSAVQESCGRVDDAPESHVVDACPHGVDKDWARRVLR